MSALSTLSVCPQDERVQSVRQGNSLAVVTTVLCLLGWLVDVGFIVEQPMSSILGSFPCISKLFKLTEPTEVCTWMGAFNGATPKPLRLWGTSKWVCQLKRVKPATSAGRRSLVKKKGKQVTGLRAALKESQSYTAAFGAAAADARMSHLAAQALSGGGVSDT